MRMWIILVVVNSRVPFSGYSQPHTPIKYKWSQKVAVAWCGHHRGVHIITGNLCPIPAVGYNSRRTRGAGPYR